MEKYKELKESGFIENADIRIRHKEGVKVVEWCEGVRLDKEDIPTGKHCYQTRHADNGDWCTPVSIAPEGTKVSCNYCGTIITDEDFELTEETALLFLGKFE